MVPTLWSSALGDPARLPVCICPSCPHQPIPHPLGCAPFLPSWPWLTPPTVHSECHPRGMVEDKPLGICRAQLEGAAVQTKECVSIRRARGKLRKGFKQGNVSKMMRAEDGEEGKEPPWLPGERMVPKDAETSSERPPSTSQRISLSLRVQGQIPDCDSGGQVFKGLKAGSLGSFFLERTGKLWIRGPQTFL